MRTRGAFPPAGSLRPARHSHSVQLSLFAPESLGFWPHRFSRKAPHTPTHALSRAHTLTHGAVCELVKLDYFPLLSLPFPSGNDDLCIIDSSPLRAPSHPNMTEKSPAWTSGTQRKKQTSVPTSTVSKEKQLFFSLFVSFIHWKSDGLCELVLNTHTNPQGFFFPLIRNSLSLFWATNITTCIEAPISIFIESLYQD